MSTATAFKYYRTFPFCAENMTDAEVSALQFAKFGPLNLAGAMGIFWNLESVDLTYQDSGGAGIENDRPALSEASASSYFGSDSTPPRNRVCSPGQMDDANFDARADCPMFAQTSVAVTNGGTEYFVIFRIRRIVYATDTGEYWIIFSIIIQLDGDGGNKAGTTDADDPECTVTSSSMATWDGSSHDFYLRSDVADTGTYAVVDTRDSWTY